MRWQCGKKTFLPSTIFLPHCEPIPPITLTHRFIGLSPGLLPALPTHPPITLTHRFKPLHPIYFPPPTGPPRLSPSDSPPSPPPPHLGPAIQLEDSRFHKTTYAPMIYTALCIMFWMRAYTLLGQVGGGWALEFLRFLGPKRHSPIGSMPFHRAQKTLEFQGPTPSHLP